MARVVARGAVGRRTLTGAGVVGGVVVYAAVRKNRQLSLQQCPQTAHSVRAWHTSFSPRHLVPVAGCAADVSTDLPVNYSDEDDEDDDGEAANFVLRNASVFVYGGGIIAT